MESQDLYKEKLREKRRLKRQRRAKRKRERAMVTHIERMFDRKAHGPDIEEGQIW